MDPDGVLTAAALQYLHDSTAGRWDEAAPFVAEGARFIFPGGSFDSLASMRDGLERRYTDLEKRIEETDVAERSDGTVVVVVSGTLSGRNLHGVAFEGVRFLDRLVLRDGRLTEQHVYNDLAVSEVLDREA